MSDHELSAAIAADDQARDAERRDEWWSGEDQPDIETCTCGHPKRGHHPLCNGHVGKFWCHCRTFVAKTPKETQR